MKITVSQAAGRAVTGLALMLPVAGALAGDLPLPHRDGAISYITGGAPQKQAAAFERVARYYPLELQFTLAARRKDGFPSDVKVRIKDAHDRMVLNVTAEGPLMLAKLPAGRYTVSAEYDGKVENRAVEVVHDHHQRVVFEWPQA